MTAALPLFDLATAQGRDDFQRRLAQLRASASAASVEAAQAAEIIEDVRSHGDQALTRYTQKWDDPDFTAEPHSRGGRRIGFCPEIAGPRSSPRV